MRTIAVVMVVMLVGGSALAQPSSRSEAGEHFRRGEEARGEGRYRDAIASYEQAYALQPHPNALFNIALCYERLGEWSLAADNYERYLDQDKTAGDAAAVSDKVKELRAKSQPAPPPPPPVDRPAIDRPADQPIEPDRPADRPTDRPGGPGIVVPPPTASSGRSLQFGVSYGVGLGDAPVERYLAHAGVQLRGRFDVAAIGGKFGKNDLGLGVMGRVAFTRGGVATPFARAAATIGYAKQDASSDAETRYPFGFEAGGGVQLGRSGRLELDAVIRWTRGGWDMAATAVDSYINDEVAVAIDLGVTFDLSRLSAIGR